MSAFPPVPLLPQQAGSIGLRGADGATGAAGPNGAPGADGSFTLASLTLTAAQIATLNVPTPIQLTADQAGVFQVVVAAGFEINKTHLTGAGAVPNWRCQFNGLSTVALSIGAMDLGNTRNFGLWNNGSNASFAGGALNTAPAEGGKGISTAWSATYAPSTFSTSDPGAVFSAIIAAIPLRF